MSEFVSIIIVYIKEFSVIICYTWHCIEIQIIVHKLFT